MTDRQITFADARFVYYDIESLKDVFSVAAFDTKSNQIEVFYLLQPGTALEKEAREMGEAELNKRIVKAISASNPAYTAQPGRPDFMNNAERPQWLRLYDLAKPESFIRLARLMGASDAANVNDPADNGSFGTIFKPVCDTDPNYDPFDKHPFICGYNSYNYDTTMMALFFSEVLTPTGMPEILSNLNPKVLKDHNEGWTQIIKPDDPSLKLFKAKYDPPTPEYMRTKHNDSLFSDAYSEFGMPSYLTSKELSDDGFNSTPNLIRRAMLQSGRHIDFARLNETQKKVALKRILGGLGRQILESDKLQNHNAQINNVQELCELIGYNVSDVIGLAKTAEHRTYSAAFDLKVGLLNQYPETIYNKDPNKYQARIAQNNVRFNRLTPDSTSAKFVGMILSPYSKLTDYPTVSFQYPHPDIAAQMRKEGKDVQSVNVLTLCEEFFASEMGPFDTEAKQEAKKQFDEIIAYYRSIEGKNFNDSEEYSQTYGPNVPTYALKDIPKRPNNLLYFRKDGVPTTCFATFSTGGIHGAEYHNEAYKEACKDYETKERMIKKAKELCPDPKEFVRLAKEQHQRLYLDENKTDFVNKTAVIYTRAGKIQFRPIRKDDPQQNQQLAKALASGLTPEELLATQRPESEKLNLVLENGETIIGKYVLENTTEKNAKYREKPTGKKPLLFKPKVNKDGSTILDKQFAYTSVGIVIHEDFSSYYPNLLRNLKAFYNEELGEDRYAILLADKDRYQELAKEARDKGDSEAARRFDVLRNATKLLLNAASGAGDTNFAGQPIRVNNAIISMRLIGQCLTWLIGQAQTFGNGTIPSTNTDGLYSLINEDVGFTEEVNNAILAEQEKRIHVPIEPEKLLLVSKDSNNRLEMTVPKDGELPKIISASGGTLACFEEPRPDKSLAHPAVTDWALARYLRYCAIDGNNLSVDKHLDTNVGKELLHQAQTLPDTTLALRLFGQIIAASNGMFSFPFAADLIEPGQEDEPITGAKALQHYNRIFFVKRDTPGAVSLRTAGAWKVTTTSKLKRKKDKESSVKTDAVALEIAMANGCTRYVTQEDNGYRLMPIDHDVAVRKLSGIEPSWPAIINNKDLYCLSEAEKTQLLNSLDIDIYVSMLESTFNTNWSNVR